MKTPVPEIAAERSLPKPCVVVCERLGTWATLIAPGLPVEIRLRQTRTLGDCEAEMARAPGSLLVLELSRERLAEGLRLLGKLSRRDPRSAVVVVAPRELAACEDLAREAGAVHFTTSPRDVRSLARLAGRHFDRCALPQADFAAQIWDSLPWEEARRP